MFYSSTLLLLAGSDIEHISELYSDLISKCLYDTMNNSCLDILVMRSQNAIRQVERLTANLYDIAREQAAKRGRRNIKVTVLLDGRNIEMARKQNWEVIYAGKYENDLLQEFHSVLPEGSKLLGLPTIIARMPDPLIYSPDNYNPDTEGRGSLEGIAEEDEEDLAIPDYAGPSHTYTPHANGNASANSNSGADDNVIKKRDRKGKEDLGFDNSDDEDLYYDTLGKDTAVEWEHDVMAVGGTFDHLHDGHRVLLTVAGYLAKEKLIVGITGSELLVNKKYSEVLESYMTRRSNVEEFLNYVFPPLVVESYMMHDVAGPTASIEDIDALALSKETLKGGVLLNKLRISKGWKPLIVYDVDVIGCINGTAKDNYSDKLSSTELRRLEFEKLKLQESSNENSPAAV